MAKSSSSAAAASSAAASSSVAASAASSAVSASSASTASASASAATSASSAALFGWGTPTPEPERMPAVLGVHFNGKNFGEIFVLLELSPKDPQQIDDVLVLKDDLHILKLNGQLDRYGERIDGKLYVSLNKLAPGIRYGTDMDYLRLILEADPQLLLGTTIDLTRKEPDQSRVIRQHNNSLFMNYSVNLSGSTRHGLGGLYGFGEAGFSSPAGLLHSTVTSTHSFRDDQTMVRRGLTSLTKDFQKSMVRLVLGDFAAPSPGGYLGSGLMGGVSLSRNFSLNPYFSPLPTFHFQGLVESPSELEVRVGDRVLHRERVPAGELRIENLVIPSGAHDATVVLRDSFGRETSISEFYNLSYQLLKPGLHRYSYNAGFLRNTYHSNFSYSTPGVTGFHQYGVNKYLSVGGNFDVAQSLVRVAAQASVAIPYGGVISLIGGPSYYRDKLGAVIQADYQYSRERLGVGVGGMYRFADYQSLFTLNSSFFPKRTVYGNLGVSLPKKMGSLSLRAEYRGYDYVIDPVTFTLGYMRSVFWQGHLNLQAGFRGNTRYSPEDLFASMFLAFPLGKRVRTNAYTHTDGSSKLELDRGITQVEGWGGRVGINHHRHFDRLNGDVSGQINAKYATFTGRGQLGSDYVGSYMVGMAGSVAALGGSVALSRPIHNSFALVKADKVKNVQVVSNGNPMGRTGFTGNLLIPNLQAYNYNRLSLDGSSLPINVLLQDQEQYLVPTYRGGIVYRVKPRKIQAVTGYVRARAVNGEVENGVTWKSMILVGSTDQAEELQSILGRQIYFCVMAGGEGGDDMFPVCNSPAAHDNGMDDVILDQFTLAESIVGLDGLFYFENLEPGLHSYVAVSSNSRRCKGVFQVPESDDIIIDLGEVICE